VKAPFGALALLRLGAILGLASLCAIATPNVARAAGTVVIQHAGKDPVSYANVAIKLVHNTLNVTSADGKGTMVIADAACAYQGDLLVCLPTTITLVEGGASNVLDLRKGEIYANMTDSTVQMPHSSTEIPARGVLMTLVTDIGTYINLSGKIDGVSK
jgi:hypothetical protein